jgi:hypothetical protein
MFPFAFPVQVVELSKKILARSASRAFQASGLLAASCLSLGLFAPANGNAQVNVTTFHNDIGRTGQNLSETVLTTSNVNATTFGKLFSQSVSGQIYAQPLYLSGVTIGGASHNVVYVATEGDMVYAFDADTNGGGNAAPLWSASLLSTAHGAPAGATTMPSSVVGFDIQPQIGITGTPVIDPTTGTLYVVAKTQESGNGVQRLHALDVTSGAEKFGGPVVLTASVPGTGNGSVNGTLTFDPIWENQRPGLLLLNGIVWIGFAAHGDNGPWHGWILGYNAATLKQTGAFCATPNGTGAGFWMSGEGLAADQLDPVNKPFGRMFVPTGNGDYNATKPYNNTMDYGDSHLAIDLTNGVPTVSDEFTTNQQQALDNQDGDIASGGMMVIPTQTTGSYPHLAVQVGKQGYMYLLNRDNMGGYNTSADQIVQEQPYAVGAVGAWSTSAYWNGNVYWWGRVDSLKSFALTNGLLSTNPVKSTDQMGYPGATPSISANGNTQGIVWAIDSEAYGTPGPSLLLAHDATNVATLLYTSATNAARDTAGNAVKFTVPTVANGKVYVGADGELDFYGLLAGTTQTAAPSISPGTESFTGSISVSITDSTSGAKIYYTLDGSTPTTSSTLYSGSITVSSTETIKAVASATGQVLSTTSSATYTSTAQAATVAFSIATGTYTSAQSLTLTDSTTGAKIYYTTNGTTPTTSSTLYSSAITISASETITAIAVAPGYNNSAAVAQTYTINSAAAGVSFSAGFANTSGVILLNGSSQLNDTRLQLTDGIANEAGSAWYATPVNVQTFTNDFTFQLSNPVGNGITFTIQNATQGTAALGANGTSLGYAPIANSVAIKFDFATPVGTGTSSTGLYINGAVPTTPAIDMLPSGINLNSGDEMSAHMVYNGTILSMTLTDMVTSAIWSGSWTVNIPATIGSSTTAYVGFTGGTGTGFASQKILTWNFVSSATSSASATPVFSLASGTYTSAQSVTISDATSGATIYYTTDGSTPSSSSAVYSSAIAVSATKTIKAIAVVAGSSAATASAVASATYTISIPAATPTFSLVAGSYSGTQTVTLADTTSGAAIYYTTDGTTPTSSSTKYAAAISVAATETIKAIAVATGFVNSAVASATYTITGANQTATPTFITPPQTSATSVNVQIAEATAGAVLYYTTNGTTPTTSSSVYSGYIPVTTTTTLNVIAVAPGYSASAVLTGTYTIAPYAAFPTISPAGGTYASPLKVTIADTTTGAVIHYTIDQTTPTASSPVYSAPITLTGAAYVQAIAVATGYSQSFIASANYNVSGISAPVFTPAAGTYSSAQSVTIADATAGVTIYYTTDGSTPTTSSAVYSGAIAVSATKTIKAIAAVAGSTTVSAVSSATYTISTAVAAPSFTPAAGTYTSAQSVTIADATSGATIYYTTNGSTPTTSSTVYSGAIPVSATETINAIAAVTGSTASPVASATYTIATPAATPVFTPVAGTYASAQSVTISDATSGATIYYTTNGSTPTTSSTVYSGAISVSATETINAIAAVTGSTAISASAVASATYTIAVAARPTFSLASGTYSSAQSLVVTDTTPGATIYYTIDGTNPTTSSAKYTAAIAITTSETVKALATAPGYAQGPVTSGTFTITSTVAATPTFSLAAGSYTGTQSVTLSDATSGATIYYTTNGTTPTTSSTKYAAAISVPATETIEAIAVASGLTNSAVASATYTISSSSQTATPTFVQAPGTSSASVNVQLADATAGAAFYYTTDGTTPTTSSQLYNGYIQVNTTTTVKVVALAAGHTVSAVLTGVYTIAPIAAFPSISPAGGSYASPLTVTITDATAGAVIHYTIDQSTPTASSPVYSGPFTLTGAAYVQAIAVATGYTQSYVASANYNVQ